MTRGLRAGWAIAVVWMVMGTVPAEAQQFGTITFPTSGAPAAQPPFLEGVKQLHSFQFDEAGESFRQAQKLDPGFALAYWGEAMSYNHPLWAQQDLDAAKKTLERLGPTPEARLAKAPTAKEKAYLEALDQLFHSPGDKLTRDHAYSRAMARMHERWPDDHEIAVFYALSLLGTVRPSDTGFRRQALAAAICENVFKENPQHPGAAHFIIHSFDDPDHAILALPAARVYADIAPSAAHALHMPSHIFVQLGMWDRVAASNIEAYRAAAELNARMKLPEGREDFHTLSWLLYANLMLGKTDEAKKNLELARQTAERNPASGGVQNGYLGMRARYILETAQWERLPLEPPRVTAPATAAKPGAHEAHDMAAMAGMPGMESGSGRGNNAWTFIAGYSAAKLGDVATAEQADAQLRAAAQRIESGGNAYGAKPAAIMARQVAAVARLARGQQDEAVRLAKEAADIELTMAAPSGPPEPMKPALELYGEVLLEAGRAKEAAAAFEQALLRTPNRTPSVLGLARAAAKAGDPTSARERYTELVKMAGAAASAPAVQEAQR